MTSIKRTVLTLIGSALIVAMIAGAVALVATSKASAQNDVPDPDGESQSESAPGFSGRGKFGDRGMPTNFDKRGGDDDSYLADALGITVEELREAMQTANDAAIEKMLDAGLITEEQAGAMKERGGFFAKGRKGGHPGGFGDSEAIVDYDSLLADALGINVEDLQAARQVASKAAIEAAVESGKLTQEQADLMAARQALKDYLDKDALMADALGMSVDELQSAMEDGKRMSELLEEQGLSQEDFQAAIRAATEAALVQAVDDGVITQEQASLLLDAEHDFGGFPGKGRHGGRGGHDRPDGFFDGDCTPGGTETTNPENTNDV